MIVTKLLSNARQSYESTQLERKHDSMKDVHNSQFGDTLCITLLLLQLHFN